MVLVNVGTRLVTETVVMMDRVARQETSAVMTLPTTQFIVASRTKYVVEMEPVVRTDKYAAKEVAVILPRVKVVYRELVV